MYNPNKRRQRKRRQKLYWSEIFAILISAQLLQLQVFTRNGTVERNVSGGGSLLRKGRNRSKIPKLRNVAEAAFENSNR